MVQQSALADARGPGDVGQGETVDAFFADQPFGAGYDLAACVFTHRSMSAVGWPA